MKTTDTDSVLGRRPRHTTTDFEMETDVAVIEQLVRAEYPVKSGMINGKQVLDVGCGHGYTMVFFKQNGQATTVVGLEADLGLVENNNLTFKDQGIESIYYDGNTFPFQDESFDVVTCFEVLELLDSSVQQNLVKEMARVVRSAGVVVISAPNKPVYSPDGISLNPCQKAAAKKDDEHIPIKKNSFRVDSFVNEETLVMIAIYTRPKSYSIAS